jgi:hypothetical protein
MSRLLSNLYGHRVTRDAEKRATRAETIIGVQLERETPGTPTAASVQIEGG